MRKEGRDPRPPSTYVEQAGQEGDLSQQMDSFVVDDPFFSIRRTSEKSRRSSLHDEEQPSLQAQLIRLPTTTYLKSPSLLRVLPPYPAAPFPARQFPRHTAADLSWRKNTLLSRRQILLLPSSVTPRGRSLRGSPREHQRRATEKVTRAASGHERFVRGEKGAKGARRYFPIGICIGE